MWSTSTHKLSLFCRLALEQGLQIFLFWERTSIPPTRAENHLLEHCCAPGLCADICFWPHSVPVVALMQTWQHWTRPWTFYLNTPSLSLSIISRFSFCRVNMACSTLFIPLLLWPALMQRGLTPRWRLESTWRSRFIQAAISQLHTFSPRCEDLRTYYPILIIDLYN